MIQAVDDKYLETSIKTMSKEELMLKVFDGLILFTTQSIALLKRSRSDVAAVHAALRRAQKACTILMGSLDFEIGGDIARNLFRIYEFWHHELMMANMSKSAERIETLLPSMVEFRETWAEAIRRYRAQMQVSA